MRRVRGRSRARAEGRHAAGPSMTLGVAEDTSSSRIPSSAQVRMRLLRLAGFSAVRITSQWLPGDIAPPTDQLEMLRTVTGAAQLAGVRVYVSVYHPGSRTTPLTPEARAEFTQYTAALVRAVPTLDDVIVGNEPNLNRFWLPQFNPDGSTPPPLRTSRCSHQSTTRSRRSTRCPRLGRRARAARERQPDGACGRHALADRRSSATSAPPTAPAAAGARSWTASRSTRTRTTRRTRPDIRAPEHHHDRPRRLRQARGGSSGRRSTARPRPARPCPSCTTSSGSSRSDPERQASSTTRARSRRRRCPSRRRSRPTYYHAGCGSPSASRTSSACCSSTRTTRRRAQLAVGRLLRRRHAEVEPPGRARRARPHARRLDHALPGPRARRGSLQTFASPPRRSSQGQARGAASLHLDCAWEVARRGRRPARQAPGSARLRPRGPTIVASLKDRNLGRAPVRLTLTVSHPVNPGTPVSRTSLPLRPV